MKGLIAGLSLLLAGPASAQDWTYSAAVYLWFPKTDVTIETPRGTVEGELSISDALQNLDFAFMGALEARNGPWSLIGDLVYMDVSADAPTARGLAFSEVSVDSKLTLFSLYGMYRVHEDDKLSVDLGAGLRGYSTDVTTVFVGALSPTQSFESTDDWVDPLLAARLRVAFDDKWYGVLFVDGGGFGVGSDYTYQVTASVGYRVNDRWSVQGGYRYLMFDRSPGDANDLKMSLSGPIIGGIYRF
jgi:hypothetical protein